MGPALPLTGSGTWVLRCLKASVPHLQSENSSNGWVDSEDDTRQRPRSGLPTQYSVPCNLPGLFSLLLGATSAGKPQPWPEMCFLPKCPQLACHMHCWAAVSFSRLSSPRQTACCVGLPTPCHRGLWSCTLESLRAACGMSAGCSTNGNSSAVGW